MTSASQDLILKEAILIAEFMYDSVISKFDDLHPEKYGIERKIRNVSNDLIFYISLATGSKTNGATEYEWNTARKSLNALRTEYIFGSKQDCYELDPSIVVKIDKLFKELDNKIDDSKKEIEKLNKKELEPWLKKYKIYKQMEENPKNK